MRGLGEIFRAVRGLKLTGEPMSRRTSLRVGGPADIFICPQDEDDLAEALRAANESDISVFMLGRGTNLLVLDGGIRGAVISAVVGLKNFWPVEDPELYAAGLNGSYDVSCDGLIYAQAGCGLSSLVHYAAENSLSGFEYLDGIPGSIGGALKMNAGTRQGTIGDVLLKVKLMGKDGTVRFVDRRELDFGYRFSNLPDGEVIAGAFIGFMKDDREAILGRMEKNRQKRIRTQPLSSMSAGCAFKNVPEISAGALIELMGFKGRNRGGASVSAVHANFIVNQGDARASDVLALIEKIEEGAERLYGIRLNREIVVVGEP